MLHCAEAPSLDKAILPQEMAFLVLSLLLVGFSRRAVFHLTGLVAQRVFSSTSPRRETGIRVLRDILVGFLGGCVGELRGLFLDVGHGVFGSLHFGVLRMGLVRKLDGC